MSEQEIIPDNNEVVKAVKDLIEPKFADQVNLFKRMEENNEAQKKEFDSYREAENKKYATIIADLETQKQEIKNQTQAMKSFESAAMRNDGSVLKQCSSEFNKKFREMVIERKHSCVDFGDSDNAVQKDLRGTVNPDGGYIINPDFTDRFITQVYETSPIRPYAFVGTTTSDTVVLRNDLDEAEVNVGRQGGIVSKTDTPNLGERRLFVKKYVAYPELTEEMLEDPSFDAEAWLVRKIQERIPRRQNRDSIYGLGINEPEGIIGSTTKVAGTGSNDTYTTGTVYYTPSGTSDQFDVNDVIKLFFSLKADYRQNGRFFMNSRTMFELFSKQDSQNRFLLSPDLSGAQTFRFFGREIVAWEDLPDQDDATNKYPILFADLNRMYSIYDRRGVRITRDEITSPGNIKIYVSMRSTGGVANYEAGKFLKSDVN